MVRGLDLFRAHFKPYEGSFVLIGGAACHEWLASEGLEFRATKDLDIVLIVEVLDPGFVTALKAFIHAGGYEIRQRTDGPPVLYRFAKPKDDSYPSELEFFSRKPDGLDLGPDQQIVPLKAGTDYHSLSAILVEPDYYALIQTHKMISNGLPVATATALIPLKARAWLDLTQRSAAGEAIDARKLDKHRNDVFRIALALPGAPGPELPAAITGDMTRFLEAFPEAAPEWDRILTSLKETVGTTARPAVLRSTLQTYFRLTP